MAGCLTVVSLSARAQSDTFSGNPDTSVFIPVPTDTDDWTRHFRLGAIVGLNISAKFGLSANYNFGVNGNNPAQGIYDDGYVHLDQSGDTSATGNWGYDHASQYNPANTTLSFHSTSSYTLPNSAQSSVDGSLSAGLDLAYGGNLWYWKHARIGWEFGFGLLPIDVKDDNAYSVRLTQYTFNYQLPSNYYLPPIPPGSSSYQSDPSGQSPLIPAQFTTASTNNAATGTLASSSELDVMLYTFRLGPTFYWDIGSHVALSFGAGPAVGIATGELKYNDTITTGNTVTHNSGSISATDFTFGGYVNGTLLYHVTEAADIYIGAQYMPLGSADFNGNGRQSQLDLSGQLYISAGINWPF